MRLRPRESAAPCCGSVRRRLQHGWGASLPRQLPRSSSWQPAQGVWGSIHSQLQVDRARCRAARRQVWVWARRRAASCRRAAAPPGRPRDLTIHGCKPLDERLRARCGGFGGALPMHRLAEPPRPFHGRPRQARPLRLRALGCGTTTPSFIHFIDGPGASHPHHGHHQLQHAPAGARRAPCGPEQQQQRVPGGGRAPRGAGAPAPPLAAAAPAAGRAPRAGQPDEPPRRGEGGARGPAGGAAGLSEGGLACG